MRVALFDYSLFHESLALANLMGVLKIKKHDYKLFLISEEDNIIQKIKDFKPDLLCFSTYTGIHHVSFQLARFIKKHMDTPTLFGGPHVTLFPEECIKEGCVDMLCRGEGEEPLTELLDALETHQDYSKINNLWVKRSGEIIKNEIRPLIQNLDSLPLPDRSQYLKYPVLRDLPLKRFITGYGCPFQCSFCHNAVLLKEIYKGSGNYIRRKSVNRVFTEIKEVEAISTVKRVHFHDDNFNFNKKWLEEFCERYPKEIGISWSCTVRTDAINEETVKIMHGSGCVGVTYGLETANEDFRNKILKKYLYNRDFERASELFKKYNIKQISSVMLNLPGETMQDAIETLHYARRLGVYSIRPAVFTVIKRQPIVNWLLENKYIDKIPEIDNFYLPEIEVSTIHSVHMKSLIRLSRFMTLMLKFPFLEFFFRFLTYIPIGNIGRDRIYDSYLEMRFMDIPLKIGFKYFLRIKKGLNSFHRIH